MTLVRLEPTALRSRVKHNQINNKNLFVYFLASMPNNCKDIDIFEYCQYVMGAFEFHKLLNMNWVLSASGCNHGNNHRPFAEWK